MAFRRIYKPADSTDLLLGEVCSLILMSSNLPIVGFRLKLMDQLWNVRPCYSTWDIWFSLVKDHFKIILPEEQNSIFNPYCDCVKCCTFPFKMQTNYHLLNYYEQRNPIRTILITPFFWWPDLICLLPYLNILSDTWPKQNKAHCCSFWWDVNIPPRSSLSNCCW